MSFDHDQYKSSLVKLLDLCATGHWYLVDRAVSMQLDVAKTYLWSSSVIGAIAMFLVKDAGLTVWSGRLLIPCIVFACIGFFLAIFIFWGQKYSDIAFLNPSELSEIVYDQCMEPHCAVSVYTGMLNGIQEANAWNITRNTTRTKILRTAAPLLILSFICLCLSIAARILHV